MNKQSLEEQARNYVEDLIDFDRGNYLCICNICKNTFQGYKRRTTCKSCLIKHQKEKIIELTEELKLLHALDDIQRKREKTEANDGPAFRMFRD